MTERLSLSTWQGTNCQSPTPAPTPDGRQPERTTFPLIRAGAHWGPSRRPDPLTSVSTGHRRRGVRVISVVLWAAVLALTGTAATASATVGSTIETRVKAIAAETINALGAGEHIAAGQRRGEAPPQQDLAQGRGVHTYYVAAGNEAVLVHNAGPCDVDEVAQEIVGHGLSQVGRPGPNTGTHFVRGVDDRALPYYVDGVINGQVPNVVRRDLLRGPVGYFDPDKSAIIIEEGAGGTFFTRCAGGHSSMNSSSGQQVTLDALRFEQVFQISTLLTDLASFDFAEVRASPDEMEDLVGTLRDVRRRSGEAAKQFKILGATHTAASTSHWRSDSEVWIELHGELAADWIKLMSPTAQGMDARELFLRTGYVSTEPEN